MKKINLLLLILGILIILIPGFLLYGNLKEKELKEENPVGILSNPFTIKINETISNGEYNITLKNIIMHICPKGAMCIVADSIEIQIEFNKKELMLSTYNKQKESNGYNISFIKIEPNPLETREILNLANYVVTIKVDKV